MNAKDRQRVDRYLARDPELRSAAFALNLMYIPEHASTLLGMAIRAGY